MRKQTITFLFACRSDITDDLGQAIFPLLYRLFRCYSLNRWNNCRINLYLHEYYSAYSQNIQLITLAALERVHHL